jgi:hypothetical protein
MHVIEAQNCKVLSEDRAAFDVCLFVLNKNKTNLWQYTYNLITNNLCFHDHVC